MSLRLVSFLCLDSRIMRAIYLPPTLVGCVKIVTDCARTGADAVAEGGGGEGAKTGAGIFFESTLIACAMRRLAIGDG